ncbi:MAG: anaerobic ribonucleoside-triphosphate reductase activating protein [Clostridia bacterium]|nr:anaerobic ribonucleoside-triphosphate reductase activating protein [Clostridia bacterium]
MNISGFQKLTLLDFPGHTACTLFTLGCNMRCPFCHNTPLVTGTAQESYSEEEIFSFLKKRQGLLDGVAITGGEPLLQKDIAQFLRKIKDLGYSVKLDTNGSFPDKLSLLLEEGLVDFVAMDIKNTKEKYSLTSGVEIDFSLIEKSVDIIKNSGIDREFRTTVVKEYHTEEDIISIAKFLGKTEKYYLQCFKDSGDILSEGCSAPDSEMLKSAAEKAKEYVLLCETRGI